MNQVPLWEKTVYDDVLRLLVCGSRTMKRVHIPLIRQELERVPQDCVIVHGAQGVMRLCTEGCPGPHFIYPSRGEGPTYVESGADMLADEVAWALGLRTEPHPADWRLGRKAGLRRNIEMLETGVDMVLAFHDGVSPGTAHTLREAGKRGIRRRIVGFHP